MSNIIQEMSAAMEKFMEERRDAGAMAYHLQQALISAAFALSEEDDPGTMDVHELHYFASQQALIVSNKANK